MTATVARALCAELDGCTPPALASRRSAKPACIPETVWRGLRGRATGPLTEAGVPSAVRGFSTTLAPMESMAILAPWHWIWIETSAVEAFHPVT